jgi:hypothetical protein
MNMSTGADLQSVLYPGWRGFTIRSVRKTGKFQKRGDINKLDMNLLVTISGF